MLKHLFDRVLIYPPSGGGSITVCEDDVKRLEEGEFLNDTIIEFFSK